MKTAVLARNGKAFQARYGDAIRVLGQFPSTGLSNGGEKITLRDPSGDVVVEFEYDDEAPWAGADGDGNSLHRVSVSAPANDAKSWRAAAPSPGVTATPNTDLNGDELVNAQDVDHLCAQIAGNADFDLNGDGSTNSGDFEFYIVDLLQTVEGDANLDGVFDSTDFVTVFRAGQYEDAVEDNSGWAEGDWNCDGDFTTTDLVVAFRRGGYVANAAGQRRRQ